MAKKLKTLFAIFTVLGFGTLPTEHVNAQSTIKVVGNHAPPFRIITGRNFSGIYFDIIKEISRRAGFKIEFINQPVKRELRSMQSGDADIMIGANRSPEREAYMLYLNAPLAKVKKVFYVLQDAPVITQYGDLHSKVVAVQRGNLYFPPFDKDESVQKVETHKYEQAIKLLLIKRVDVVIMPELEGDYLLQQLAVKLKKSPFFVEGRLSYITISKKSSVLKISGKIEKIMAQMSHDGTVKKILNRYAYSDH